jgi:hypothetical protein
MAQTPNLPPLVWPRSMHPVWAVVGEPPAPLPPLPPPPAAFAPFTSPSAPQHLPSPFPPRQPRAPPPQQFDSPAAAQQPAQRPAPPPPLLHDPPPPQPQPPPQPAPPKRGRPTSASAAAARAAKDAAAAARQAAEAAADVLFGQAAPTNTNTDKIKDAMAEVAPILERHGLKAMQPTAANLTGSAMLRPLQGKAMLVEADRDDVRRGTRSIKSFGVNVTSQGDKAFCSTFAEDYAIVDERDGALRTRVRLDALIERARSADGWPRVGPRPRPERCCRAPCVSGVEDGRSCRLAGVACPGRRMMVQKMRRAPDPQTLHYFLTPDANY